MVRDDAAPSIPGCPRCAGTLAVGQLDERAPHRCIGYCFDCDLGYWLASRGQALEIVGLVAWREWVPTSRPAPLRAIGGLRA